MGMNSQMAMHPTIRKCLQHLDVIQADDKTKQIVYMYMETLLRDKNMASASQQQIINDDYNNQ